MYMQPGPVFLNVLYLGFAGLLGDHSNGAN